MSVRMTLRSSDVTDDFKAQYGLGEKNTAATPDHPPDLTRAWIWDVERKVWQMGPMGAPDCICGAGPCKGCAYGKAKKDGPLWWAK
jgi:hypothetical protein